MTPRQKRFVEEYARSRNGRAAALAAGYAPSCADAIASRNLRVPAVAAALVASGVELAFEPHSATHRRIVPFLTARQQRFVEHYLVLGNAAEAARRAGYARRSAGANATRLLRSPQVGAVLAAANAERAAKLKIDAQRVLTEFARIGFVDPGALIETSAEGRRLKPFDQLSPDERGALGDIVITEGKDGARIRVRIDRLRALENIARHLQLYKPQQAALPQHDKDSRDELRRRFKRLMGMPDEEK